MIALSIYSLIFLAFFVGSLVGYGWVPNAFSWSIEGIIVLLFLMAMGRNVATGGKIRLFGLPIVALFCVVCFISAILNNTSPFGLLLFLRQCLRFHLLLWILLSLDLPENLMLKMHKLLIVLFLIQIPTAIVKLFIYGQGEQAIGTYGMRGGGNSTVIPAVAVSFIMCYHLLYKKRPINWLMILGFLAFGIIGGKRATVVFIPLTLVFVMFVSSRQTLPKIMKTFAFGGIGFLMIFYLGVRLMPALNPDDKIGGRFSADYAFDFMQRYNSGVSEAQNLSYGRIVSTERIYESLRDGGTEVLMFGLGPGEFMKSSFGGRDVVHFKERLSTVGVAYGISVLNFLALQVGYLGTVVWIAFFVYAMLKLNRFAQRETDPYWQAYFKSMVCVSFVGLVISGTYNNAFLEDDLIAMAYMMLLAFAIRRHTLHGSVRVNHSVLVTERI